VIPELAWGQSGTRSRGCATAKARLCNFLKRMLHLGDREFKFVARQSKGIQLYVNLQQWRVVTVLPT
jgi:hypothetical protein